MSASLGFRNDQSDCFLPDEEFNISNSRAAAVLSALGYNPELYNNFEEPVDSLLESIRLFQSSDLHKLIDQGKEPHYLDAQKETPRWLEMGIRPDYITKKVEILRSLCLIAAGKGFTTAYLS